MLKKLQQTTTIKLKNLNREVNEMAKRMMEDLEDARRASEGGYATIAMGNGDEIIYLFDGVETTDECVAFFKDLGYWVVNRFIDGKPVGLGI